MPALKQWETDYLDAQPENQVCRDCGKAGHRAYVQPQWPRRRADLANFTPYALCGDCIGRINREINERRREQLDACPRCEIEGCSRRGSVRVAGCLLLCGRHHNRCRAGHLAAQARCGSLAWLPMPYDRADLIRWAQGDE